MLIENRRLVSYLSPSFRQSLNDHFGCRLARIEPSHICRRTHTSYPRTSDSKIRYHTMARSREELLKMNEVSPELTDAMRKRPFPDLPSGPAHREARAAHLRTLRHLMPVPGPIPDQVIEQTHEVPARDGHKITVISYRPKNATANGPLIALFHEGGWINGDRTDEEFNARLLTRELGVTCLNTEYRLAPEYPFPTGVNDCWDVVQWAADPKNSASLLADPTKGFLVGGSSAGGNISAILAHLSRTHNLSPPITGQWLSVPYLIPSAHMPEKYRNEFISATESQSDPVLKNYNDNNAHGGIRAALKADITSPLFSVVSPAYYPPTPENQKGKRPLARAFFQVAGLDPLRDQALIYDRILREEYGVETKVCVYSGFGHMFWSNWPEMPTSQAFSTDMVNGMKWLLVGK